MDGGRRPAPFGDPDVAEEPVLIVEERRAEHFLLFALEVRAEVAGRLLGTRPPPPSGPRPAAEATAELDGSAQPRGLGDAEPTDPIHLLNFTVRDLSQGAEGGEERLSLVGAVGPGTLDPKEEAQALGVRQRLGLFGHEALARQSSLGHSRIVG